MCDSSEYRSWAGMKSRCNNPNHSNYHYYGGRGIKVCSRWNQSFKAFLADLGRKPYPKYTLDRIDNSGGYKPSNCRWTTQSEQRKNSRSARLLTVNGKTMCVLDWAKELYIHPTTIYFRLNAGWSSKKALGPVRQIELVTFQKRTKTISCWAKEFGLNPITLNWRLKAGWSIRDAFQRPLRN